MRTEISTHRLSSQHCPKALLKFLRCWDRLQVDEFWAGPMKQTFVRLARPATCHPQISLNAKHGRSSSSRMHTCQPCATRIFWRSCLGACGHFQMFNQSGAFANFQLTLHENVKSEEWCFKELCVCKMTHNRVMYRHITQGWTLVWRLFLAQKEVSVRLTLLIDL